MGVLAGLIDRKRTGKGCHVDAAQFERVVDNLVSNAAQAMGGNGRITVRARRAGGADTIGFADAGNVWLAEQDAPKVVLLSDGGAGEVARAAERGWPEAEERARAFELVALDGPASGFTDPFEVAADASRFLVPQLDFDANRNVWNEFCETRIDRPSDIHDVDAALIGNGDADCGHAVVTHLILRRIEIAT